MSVNLKKCQLILVSSAKVLIRWVITIKKSYYYKKLIIGPRETKAERW